MRLLIFIVPFLLVSCGSNKKLSESFQDKSKIDRENLTKIDTSRSFSFNDSLKITTEITVREFDVVTVNDTVIVYVSKERTETTTAEEGSSENETQKGESEASEKDNSDLNIQGDREEEKETYDPEWIKYLFWILLLLSIVGIFFWLKSKFKW